MRAPGARNRRGRGAIHARGSTAVTLLVVLLGLLAMLGIAEVGYLYYAKRDLQKVADLAALSGAQRTSACSEGNDDNTAARGNAVADNGFKGALAIACGHWSPTAAGDQHFEAGGAPVNAVRVQASESVAPVLGLAGTLPDLHATAVARGGMQPIAAFSVGSSLVDLSGTGPLQQLLDSALGTSLGLKLLSSTGIANANVSLLGLRDALGLDAGTVDGVLDSQVDLAGALDATVQLLAAGSDSANVDLVALQQQVAAIEAQLGDVPIRLGDILDVEADTTDPEQALDVDVNAADLVGALVMAANARHAVEIDAAHIGLPGVADVELSLSVVEPPKIGIGPAGYNADGTPRTVAHTAQVRLRLAVSALQATNADTTLLDVAGLVKVMLPSGSLVKLPLNLELVPAEAWLDDLQCRAQADGGGLEHRATLKLRPGALALFLGNLPDSTYQNDNRRWQDIVDAAIADGSAYAPLLNVKLVLLLLQPVVNLEAYASAPVVRADDAVHTFHVDPRQPVSQQAGMDWSVDTGQQLLASALTAVLSPELLHIRIDTQGLSLLGSVVDALVNGVLTIVGNLLPVLEPILLPVAQALDQSLVGPLLRLLGAGIGEADVRLMSVHCDDGVQLVY